MTATEWQEIERLIRERWPEWRPNRTEIADWKRALGALDFRDVNEALFRVRLRYVSNTPRLKWVIDVLREIRDERHAAAAEDETQDRLRREAEAERDMMPPEDVRQTIAWARERGFKQAANDLRAGISPLGHRRDASKEQDT